MNYRFVPNVTMDTIVGAHQRRQLRPGGMAHQENPVRIAPAQAGIIVNPADGFRNVPYDRDLYVPGDATTAVCAAFVEAALEK